jgi:hypothetical protein
MSCSLLCRMKAKEGPELRGVPRGGSIVDPEVRTGNWDWSKRASKRAGEHYRHLWKGNCEGDGMKWHAKRHATGAVPAMPPLLGMARWHAAPNFPHAPMPKGRFRPNTMYWGR